jgi:predicted 3-demethylubiquinone-9 3-methyltransferase (glyoxalase superfamily)
MQRSRSAEEDDMRKITPFLWFDKEAEEAANFYVSVFKNSKIVNVSRYGAAGPGRQGSVMSVIFELEGQPFYALNGGPLYTFTPAISLFVDCETQEEVDALWEKLCDAGRPNRCGWLTDKYGLSWQIIPSVLSKLVQSGDREASNRAMKAMLAMGKLDIAALQSAFDGK